MTARFRDRTDAGRRLAAALMQYADRPDVRILALPRGGVPVGYEVARALDAPLDVFLVRKLGLPGHEELAMGAIASGGTLVLNEELVEALDISPITVERVAQEEQRELVRREQQYRGNQPELDVAGYTVIVVDDGLATGSSMHAAVAALRRMRPQSIIVAVPIAAPEVCEAFRDQADDVICLRTPESFQAVGLWYENFPQTTDEEVHALLTAARKRDPTDYGT